MTFLSINANNVCSYNGGVGKQHPKKNFSFYLGDCFSHLLSGAKLQMTSGRSANAPVISDA